MKPDCEDCAHDDVLGCDGVCRAHFSRYLVSVHSCAHERTLCSETARIEISNLNRSCKRPIAAHFCAALTHTFCLSSSVAMEGKSDQVIGQVKEFYMPKEGGMLAVTRSINPESSDALIVVDCQNDFCTGGQLATRNGEEVVPVVNSLMRQDGWGVRVLTQDWHPPAHASFASSHPGKSPFESVTLSYDTQTLWPDHCIQGSNGAEFHPELILPSNALLVRKGFRPSIDSYSAFFENDHSTSTGLAEALRARGIQRVFVTGLALDVCVRATAEDAANAGFSVVLLEDATRAVPTDGGIEATRQSMLDHGVALSSATTL